MGLIPPGNNYPSPGYPPPGYYPPVGGNMAPQPVAVEPASGPITKAWTQIALRPDRHLIAAGAQAAPDSWAMISIITAALIGIAGSLVGSLILGVTKAQTDDGKGVLVAATTFGNTVSGAINKGISAISGIVIFAMILAFFMPSAIGTFRTRYQRAVKPIAIAAIGIQVFNFILTIVSSAISIKLGPYLHTLIVASKAAQSDPTAAQNAFGQAIGPVLGLSAPILVLAIGYAVYTIFETIQSGSIGSGLSNRWAVFGGFLLALILTGFIATIVSFPLSTIGN